MLESNPVLPQAASRPLYAVDPRVGPRCGGMLKILVVTERSAVFRQIPGHLGLPTGPVLSNFQLGQ